MKTLIVTIFILIGSSACFSQNYEPPVVVTSQTNLQQILKRPLCLSGATYAHGKLYMVSEMCHLIIEYDPNNDSFSEKSLTGLGNSHQLEAITYTKGHFFITAEYTPSTGNRGAAIYEVFPGREGTIWTAVEISAPHLTPSWMDGSNVVGPEGIVIDTLTNKMYVLQERTQNDGIVQITTYDFSFGQYGSSLQHVRTNDINVGSGWRFSDLFLVRNNAAATLYCLRTKKGGYGVSTLPIDAAGNFTSLVIQPLIQNIQDNITDRSYFTDREKYSSNLEGLAIDENGNIYIVSDNVNGEVDCSASTYKREGLFIKIKKQAIPARR